MPIGANKIVFRRMVVEGVVCHGIAELNRTCTDPAKYDVWVVIDESNSTTWHVCADHARDLLFYKLGHL